MTLIRAAALAVLTLLAPPRVTLRVYPRVVPAGEAVRVTCHVAPDARNRGLTYGLADYTSSYSAIDGANGPITVEQTFDHVPCDPGPAFCTVEDDRHHQVTDQLDLVVANCDEP